MANRNITAEEATQAYALWLAAKHRYAEAEMFEEQLNALLGRDDAGSLSEAIYGPAEPERAVFDAALAKDGILVDPSDYSASGNPPKKRKT